ncbi:MAG TPA: LPS-assembly protein LptD, partial [Desulfobacteraceae bacterium]|nr:LPS-assembly protein LptD [Desulfobacteraceae bacterium]
MKITPGSYGFVKHSALWVRDIPVAYIPFLIFPVNLKRQSGLLAPEMGHSDRKGIEYTQPFYWAIDDSSDATVYYQYMEKRGNKIGLEYRYVLNEHAKGLIMLDVLNDRQTDIGSPESVEKWGYAGDAYSRPNSDRYWFRMKHDQPLPLGFFGRVDLDIVSDQDYLNEFKDG